jgi:hypothetical protein
MLGSESGSNAFDFDGLLDEAISAFTALRKRPPTYQEFKDVLDPLEAPFDIGQISPRVFECAAMMTPMILFRGRYSNAIEANVHYIPLEKDFANVEGILARLDDLEYLQGFADRAYRHLVQSGAYGYRSLARLLEDTIEQQYPLWIDPKWLTYRSRMAQLCTLVDRSADRKMYVEAPRGVLGERPTELPLGMSEFNERQLRGQVQATRVSRPSRARRAWRLIPTAQRYWLASLILPVWLLLPMRVRRGIASSFL